MKGSFMRLRIGLKGIMTLSFLLCCTSALFAQLSGSYTVGSAGTYSTITSAVAAYNSSTLAGPVTFVLTDATYPSETFPITINNNADASATNTLTITPGAGVAATITGLASTTAIFKLLDARYVSIDGINTGGSSITINNINTGASAAIWLASTATTGPGCKNITLKNLNINGGSNTTSSDWGIIAGANGTTPSTTGGMDNDNVTIQGNTFLKCGYGIYAKGTAVVTAGGLDNWTIDNNTFGPTASGTTNIGYNGIYFTSALNATITGNTIQSIGATGGSSQVVGINLNSGVNGFTIARNTIKNVSSGASTSGTNSNAGIYLGSNAINGSIDRNNITGISNTSTSGYGVRGITINTGTATSALTLSNNMIADVWCYADVSIIYAPVGIDVEGTSGGVNLYFNSVNLFGSHTGYSSGDTRAIDLYMNSSGGNMNIRNNIFANSYDNTTSSSDKSYTIYSTYPATAYSAIDYNDYYVAPPTGVLAYLSSDQTTLAAVQAAFGGNTHSITSLPVFVSATDLHLQVVGANAPLVAGVAITGITTDIDGSSRSATTPVMGAHEVSLPACTSVTAGTAVPATAAFCASGSTTISLSGATGALGITYQWQSSADSASWTTISGATASTYTTPTITATTFYRVVLTCSFSGVSDSVTTKVIIHPLPVIAVTPDGGGICTGVGLSMTASGATTYTWLPGGGLSSTAGATITATPSVTTTYTVTGTDVFGCQNTHASTVAVTITPSAVTVTPDSATVCPGSPQTLSASAMITGPGMALSQDFNSGLGGWTVDNTGTTSSYPNVTFTVHGDGYINELGTYHSPDNSGFILTNSDTAGSGVTVHSILISPSFSLAGYSAATLKFQHNYRYYGSGDVSASVEISTDGGTTWGLLHNYTSDGVTVGTTTSFVAASLNLASYVGMPNVMVRFNYQSVYGYDWAIDNISVSGTVSVPATNITWAPGTGLYNDASLTSPYTGGTAATVYAAPTAPLTYTATATNGACTSTGTAVISVNAAADPGTITGASVVCAGSAITLTDATTGGVWSTSNTHATVSASGVVTGVSAGVDTISYSVTNVCGTASATRVVTINPLPNAGTIAGPSAVCVGSSVTLTDAAPGGVWSTTSTAVSVSGGIVTGIHTGTALISYTVTNSCGVATATKMLTVNPLPVAGTISGISAVCEGSTITLTDSATGGVWSSGSASASVDAGAVTGLAAGTATISYAVTNSCGTATATKTITVNPLPTMYTVTGGGTYCAGGTGVLIGLDGSQPGITYQLYTSGSLTASATGTGGAISFGTQTTAGTYAATAVNTATGCTDNMIGSADVIINPTASPSVSISTSTGDTICAATAVTFTAIPENGGATPTYVWSVNGTAVGSGAIYTYVPSNGDVVSVTITSSSCAMPNTATASITMTVTSVLMPSVSITTSTGSDSACAGYPVTLTAVPVNGGSTPGYTWTRNGIHVATGPTFTFTPVNGDVVYVTMGSSLPCSIADSVNSAHHTMHVIPLTLPSVTIVAHPGLVIAPGTSDTLVALVLHAGTAPTYQWKINGATIAGATNATFVSSSLVNGDVVSCYVTSGGLCSGLTTYASVTIHTGSTGIATIDGGSGDIKVFPNPNKGVFTVNGNLPNSGTVTLEITDMLGQTIYKNKTDIQQGQLNQQITLDNNLANGVYLLKIYGENEQYTVHVVIAN